MAEVTRPAGEITISGFPSFESEFKSKAAEGFDADAKPANPGEIAFTVRTNKIKSVASCLCGPDHHKVVYSADVAEKDRTHTIFINGNRIFYPHNRNGKDMIFVNRGLGAVKDYSAIFKGVKQILIRDHSSDHSSEFMELITSNFDNQIQTYLIDTALRVHKFLPGKMDKETAIAIISSFNEEMEMADFVVAAFNRFGVILFIDDENPKFYFVSSGDQKMQKLDFKKLYGGPDTIDVCSEDNFVQFNWDLIPPLMPSCRLNGEAARTIEIGKIKNIKVGTEIIDSINMRNMRPFERG